MSSFKDAMSQRQRALNEKTSETDRRAGEAWVQARVTETELEQLDSFREAAGLTRVQVVRAAIHLLREPAFASALAEKAVTLPSKKSAGAAQKAAAWAEQQAEEES